MGWVTIGIQQGCLIVLLDNWMSAVHRQSIFKIVSLAKHQPIFLLRNGEGRKGGGQGEIIVESAGRTPRRSMKSVREEIQKISGRVGMGHGSSGWSPLEQRSQSCDLRHNCKEKTGQKPESLRSKQSSQRTMKEYLRLAYKRSQLQRKLNVYKLPALIKSPNPQKERNDDESALRPPLKSNRLPLKEFPGRCRLLKKGRIFDPLYDRSILAKSQAISGWDGDVPHDDF